MDVKTIVKIGYTAYEQHHPTQLLEYTIFVEQAGFDTIWASDHFILGLIARVSPSFNLLGFLV